MDGKIARKRLKTVCLLLFSLYLLILLRLTIFRFDFHHEERQLNVTLFTGLLAIWRNGGIGEFLWLFLGNIGWFVPFGFLFPMLLKRKSLLLTMACGFLFSLLIEATQFVFYKGVAELDDLILNTLGTAIGCFLFTVSSGFMIKLKRIHVEP